MDYQLDLREYRCPLPLLMTKKALQNLPNTATLQVLLAKQSSLSDFELLANQQGYSIQRHDKDDKIELAFRSFA